MIALPAQERTLCAMLLTRTWRRPSRTGCAPTGERSHSESLYTGRMQSRGLCADIGVAEEFDQLIRATGTDAIE